MFLSFSFSFLFSSFLLFSLWLKPSGCLWGCVSGRVWFAVVAGLSVRVPWAVGASLWCVGGWFVLGGRLVAAIRLVDAFLVSIRFRA